MGLLGLVVALRISDRPLADLALPFAALLVLSCYHHGFRQIGEWGIVASTVVLTASTLLLFYQHITPVWLPPAVVFVCRATFMDNGLVVSLVWALLVLCVTPYALRTIRHAHPLYGGAAALLLASTPIAHNTTPLLLLVVVDRFWHGWKPLLAAPGCPIWVDRNLAKRFTKCADLMDVPFARLIKRTRPDRETGYISVEVEHQKEGVVFVETLRIYIKRAWLNLLRLAIQSVRKFRVPFSDSFEEVRAFVALQQVGLEAPRPVAACTVTRFLKRRTAIATLDIGHFERLTSLLEMADFKKRREVARQLGRLVARMHSAAINHRDLYAEHIVFLKNGGIVLLDLNRAQVRHRLPQRWRVKDLAALFVSTNAPATDKLRFLLSYLDIPSLTPNAKRLARKVLKRSDGVARKRAAEKEREIKNGWVLPPP
ncbi:MAG: hypothetical protein DRP63_05675 [Planctomycetota bacterium]|nr:MAG: hypothetical protein DRP63_05675 [Planctomycetota bacterium]